MKDLVRIVSYNQFMIVFFNSIEFWWRNGSWCRPSEWVFEINRCSLNNCLVIEIGFFGISFLKMSCKW